MREIQRLLVTQTLTRDEWTLTINNPDGGTFQIGILDPKSNTFYWSPYLSTNASSWIMTTSVGHYYGTNLNAGVSVNKVNYDVNGAITYNPNNVVQTVFTIIC
jgi:hypothetical protein